LLSANIKMDSRLRGNDGIWQWGSPFQQTTTLDSSPPHRFHSDHAPALRYDHDDYVHYFGGAVGRARVARIAIPAPHLDEDAGAHSASKTERAEPQRRLA